MLASAAARHTGSEPVTGVRRGALLGAARLAVRPHPGRPARGSATRAAERARASLWRRDPTGAWSGETSGAYADGRPASCGTSRCSAGARLGGGVLVWAAWSTVSRRGTTPCTGQRAARTRFGDVRAALAVLGLSTALCLRPGWSGHRGRERRQSDAPLERSEGTQWCLERSRGVLPRSVGRRRF